MRGPLPRAYYPTRSQTDLQIVLDVVLQVTWHYEEPRCNVTEKCESSASSLLEFRVTNIIRHSKDMMFQLWYTDMPKYSHGE